MIFVSQEDLEQVILAIRNRDFEDAIKLLEEIIEEESIT
jgi:ribosomal protein L22